MASISGGFSAGFSIALSGLNDARLRMDAAAHNIANANTDNFTPSRVVSEAVASGGVASIVETPLNPNPDFHFPSQTDLVGELVNTLIGQRAFEAGAKVLSANLQASGSLIDALG